MIKILPYDVEHFSKIKLRACHAQEGIKAPEYVNAVTVFKDDSPIAIFGGIDILPGILQVWGLISDDVRKCPLGFHKAALHLLKAKFSGGYRRVQMTVRSDFLCGWKWAKALGFQSEGIMRKYGPDGTDYILFSRVAR